MVLIKPMKKLLLLGFLSLFLVNGYAQMRRPTIMVVPSDVWCFEHGYVLLDQNGQRIPDYQAALQSNGEIRSLIGSLGNMMASYDFPLKNLEAELRKMKKEEQEMQALASQASGAPIAENAIDRLRRSAKCDIIIDVNYKTLRNGPVSKVVFNITAIDPYSSMEVAACPPVETPAVTASVEKLLDTAVQDVKATFCSKIQHFFEDTFKNGRNARILLKRFEDCPYTFDQDVDYFGEDVSFSEVIQLWMNQLCVEGRYSIADESTNTLDFNPARIPVRKENIAGREVAIDAAGFARDLAKKLKSEYGIQSRVYSKGLGEAWVILGSSSDSGEVISTTL